MRTLSARGSMGAHRFATPAQVSEVEALAAVAGPVRAVERSRLETVGYTGASHERLDLTLRTGAHRRLVVKRVRLSTDWTVCRSSDRRGREAAMLAEPALGAIWDAFVCPYLGFAAEGDEVALVMEDLSPVALERLPPAVTELLTAPAAELAWLWNELPRTLLHGDAKIANFALLPDQRVAAFDWALLGSGPATLDVGWYLAVNATRLSRSKQDTLGRYRALLSATLGAPLPDALWASLVRAGIVVGARMLLWSKALAAEADRPGARAEWAWWAEDLDAVCA